MWGSSGVQSTLAGGKSGGPQSGRSMFESGVDAVPNVKKRRSAASLASDIVGHDP